MITHLTKSDIEEINNSKSFDSWYQGIFTEPFGVPNDMKETVVYMRWCTGGASGGSCYGDDLEYFVGEGEPDFVVLDKVLEKIVPTLSFLHYKEIKRSIISTEESDYQYYGNYNDWDICFIPLSTIYEILDRLGY